MMFASIWCACMFLAIAYFCAASMHLPRACAGKQMLMKVVVAVSVIIPVVWALFGTLVAIASSPLLLTIRQENPDRYLRDLYTVFVIRPGAREALRKRYGSATAADYLKYLSEAKEEELRGQG